MSRSQKFEQRVSRIHRLLEADGSSVTWNDRIPDPDNPDQLRQVDILIRRPNQTVHIECRSHKSPQDVQWIEELIGRRESLGADQIIAASDSGFTDGARRKAIRHGIILRDLHEVTEREVSSWGQRTEIEFCYYQVSNIALQPVFTASPPSAENIGRYFLDRMDILSSALNGSKYTINTIPNRAFPLCIQVEVIPSAPLEIEGVTVRKVGLRYEVNEVRRKHLVATVLAYTAPTDDVSPSALVEVHESIDLEIIKSALNCFVYIDLSSVPLPLQNEMFAGIAYLENVWNLSVAKTQLVGNQELPIKVSTFDLIIPPSQTSPK
jgi:Restriction endonuclease